MCRRKWYARVAALPLVLVMILPLRAAVAEDGAVRRGDTAVRTFDLPGLDETPEDLFSPSPLAFTPLAPEPEEAPVVVPLPPPLAMGVAGLGALAAARAARRVYRRR